MPASSFFSKQQWLLTWAALLVITGLALLPYNRQWLARIAAFYRQVPGQAAHMNVAYRRAHGYGTGYLAAQKVKEAIRQSTFRGEPLILLPPASCLRRQGIKTILPEPAVFYNYTGLHAVWKNSNLVHQATHIVTIVADTVQVAVVKSDKAVDSFLTKYAPYDAGL